MPPRCPLNPELHLLLEAPALVDGGVELGEGVGKLGVIDEQLEPLGKPEGGAGGTPGQRRYVH